MNINRKISLFLVSYGRLLFIIIAIIVGFIYILQSINNHVKKQNMPKKAKQIIIQEETKREIDVKQIISKFINYCNSNQIEKAYNMLSEKCKKEKYVTKEEFKKQYVEGLFKIKICKHEIKNQTDFYIVNLTQDMLITGKTNSILQTKIQVENNKIYIYN